MKSEPEFLSSDVKAQLSQIFDGFCFCQVWESGFKDLVGKHRVSLDSLFPLIDEVFIWIWYNVYLSVRGKKVKIEEIRDTEARSLCLSQLKRNAGSHLRFFVLIFFVTFVLFEVPTFWKLVADAKSSKLNLYPVNRNRDTFKASPSRGITEEPV